MIAVICTFCIGVAHPFSTKYSPSRHLNPAQIISKPPIRFSKPACLEALLMGSSAASYLDIWLMTFPLSQFAVKD